MPASDARDAAELGLRVAVGPALLARRFLSAEMLSHFQDGQLARACGIVTVRQRPATAKGVLFMTLEDETGNINVVVWPDLVLQQRREVLFDPIPPASFPFPFNSARTLP